MEKKYRFIRIFQVSGGRGMKSTDKAAYVVENNKSGATLGFIEWYPQWRQYVFSPLDAIFSQDCLLDIVDFIKLLK